MAVVARVRIDVAHPPPGVILRRSRATGLHELAVACDRVQDGVGVLAHTVIGVLLRAGELLLEQHEVDQVHVAITVEIGGKFD